MERTAMSDSMVRATAAEGEILAFAACTADLVEEARQRHGMTPVVSAALGRTMTAAAMMGWQMKGEKDLLTIQIEGSGPIGGLVAIADSKGNVKGYANNPQVDLPLNSKGKLDVATAVGIGVMSVIRDIGLKEPYTGQTHLVTSEIAEDLAYYFTASEQVPSAVSLGVLVNRDQSIWTAGGFILQMMPGAKDETAQQLQDKVSAFMPVTEYLAAGHTPVELMHDLLGEFGVEILETHPVGFQCNCTRERVEKALVSIGRQELSQLIEEGEPVEMRCHYCNEAYQFTIEELKELVATL